MTRLVPKSLKGVLARRSKHALSTRWGAFFPTLYFFLLSVSCYFYTLGRSRLSLGPAGGGDRGNHPLGRRRFRGETADVDQNGSSQRGQQRKDCGGEQGREHARTANTRETSRTLVRVCRDRSHSWCALQHVAKHVKFSMLLATNYLTSLSGCARQIDLFSVKAVVGGRRSVSSKGVLSSFEMSDRFT